MTDKFAKEFGKKARLPVEYRNSTGYEAFSIWWPMYVWFNKDCLHTKDDFIRIRKRGSKLTYYNHLKQKDNQERHELLVEWERKYSTTSEIMDAFVSNFILGDMHGGLWNLESDQNFKDWKKRIQSMTYMFREDVEKLIKDSNEDNQFFLSVDGKEPLLSNYGIMKEIGIETYIILNTLYGCSKGHDDFYKKEGGGGGDKYLNPEWVVFKRSVERYSLFLNIDYDKYKMEMVDISKKL